MFLLMDFLRSSKQIDYQCKPWTCKYRRGDNLDYKGLYELWLEERASSSLQKIPADFYISMDGKLAKLYRKSQNLEWGELSDTIIERMEFLRKDLTKLRLKKIMDSVINNVSIDEGVLTWGERLLIKNIQKSIETLGIEKPQDIFYNTEDISPKTDLPEDTEAEHSQIEANNDILASPANLIIRILDDVEAFVGLDNKQYGPLIKYDVVCLPLENAKALIAKGMARAIETREDILKSGEKM
jgi:DNA replication initiation complex subunit (GINS family)